MNSAEDWQAVDDAVRQRMRQLGESTTSIALKTGLSQTTIRYLGRGRRNMTTLAVLSAVLGWKHDHLSNIAHGEGRRNAPGKPYTQVRLADIAEQLEDLRREVQRISTYVVPPGWEPGMAAKPMSGHSGASRRGSSA